MALGLVPARTCPVQPGGGEGWGCGYDMCPRKHKKPPGERLGGAGLGLCACQTPDGMQLETCEEVRWPAFPGPAAAAGSTFRREEKF